MSLENGEKVLALVDKDYILRLATDLCDIYSPTGDEKAVADFIYNEFGRLGLQRKYQEIYPGRFNVVGQLEGTGGGPTLMLNGHMDISHTHRESEIPGEGYTFIEKELLVDEYESGQSRVVDDEWATGPGIMNMKSALAAYLGAVAALKEAGVSLPGDLIIAAVSGEIEKTSVDGYRGPEYDGYGVGTRYLITHGVSADMCILGEPTALKICPGHAGTVWLKLTVRGQLAHTAYSGGVVNAIDEMAYLMALMKQWGREYENSRRGSGIELKVNLGAVQGGWPWRVSRTAPQCSLYLDVRTPPNCHPMDVKQEIEEVLHQARCERPGLRVELEMLLTEPGAMISSRERVYQGVWRSHQKVTGVEPEVVTMGWISDATHLNRYGIPTVLYGPAGRTKEGADLSYGWQRIDDLTNASKVYALAVLDLCSDQRRRSEGWGTG